MDTQAEEATALSAGRGARVGVSGRGRAAAVLHSVAGHRQPVHMSRLAERLAGHHVLVLLAHQPVLHQAGCLHRHVVLQPAAVPLLEVLVVAQQDQGLHLQGAGERRIRMAQAPQTAVGWPPGSRDVGREGHLLGPAERPTAVHVVLGVHDEHHLVGAEFEAAVHVAGALYPDQPLPGALGLTPQRAHLLTLPPAELLEVPGGEEDLQTRRSSWPSNTGKMPDLPGLEKRNRKQ